MRENASSAWREPISGTSSERLPSPSASMRNAASRTLAGGSSAAMPETRRLPSSPPHKMHATRLFAVEDPVTAAARSVSSSVRRNRLAESFTLSRCRSEYASQEGVHVASTSFPAARRLSMTWENASTRIASIRGRSSNTTRDAAPSTSAIRDAMMPASRSRRKHGLSQLTQKVCLNEKTTCAYSAATVDLPKPEGATRKRATSRERRSSATRCGREFGAEEATYLGRRPLHAHDIRKSDIRCPSPKNESRVGRVYSPNRESAISSIWKERREPRAQQGRLSHNRAIRTSTENKKRLQHVVCNAMQAYKLKEGIKWRK